jgi:hypothetical protein
MASALCDYEGYVFYLTTARSGALLHPRLKPSEFDGKPKKRGRGPPCTGRRSLISAERAAKTRAKQRQLRPNAAHCLGREGRRHVRHANRGLATELCDFHALEGQEPRKPAWYENGPKLAGPNPNFQRLLDVETMEARVKAERRIAMVDGELYTASGCPALSTTDGLSGRVCVCVT